jgi:acyl-CoA synthetase (NDP forming)
MLRRYGYAGPVYPINPKYTEIDGITCYPDFAAAPPGIDLAIVLAPAKHVAGAVLEAGRRGTRAAIVCSSGFGEAGPEGVELEQQLMTAAAEGGVAVLGPNSLGLVDLNHSLAATFTTGLLLDIEPKAGSIALLSQSGAMGAAIFMLAQQEGIGVGTFVSTGNETLLGFEDYVEHLADEPSVSVILGYTEGIRNGRDLLRAVSNARERGKSVAILKVGRTEAGARAARSHTGALAGDAEVIEAAFRRGGILTASSPRALLDIGVTLELGGALRGNGVAIVSASGGAGVMISDRCAELGFDVVPLTGATHETLADVLPPLSLVANPVDFGVVGGDTAVIESCLRAVASDPTVDCVLFFHSMQPTLVDDMVERLARIRSETDKPLLVAWLGGTRDTVRALRRAGIPVFEDPIDMVEAAGALLANAAGRSDGPDAELRPSPNAEELHGKLAAIGAGELGEVETRHLLASYAVPFVDSTVVTSAQAAMAAAVAAGGPVAIKVTGELHKTEVGGVALNVTPEAAGDAFQSVTAASRGATAVVQPMAKAGLELLIGVKRDLQFGPVVVVGLGGVAAEALSDVALDLAPLSRDRARDLLLRLRGAALLGEFRGRPARDIEALVDALVEVGRFAVDAGERLVELDLNPVLVYAEGEGCVAVDAAAVIV